MSVRLTPEQIDHYRQEGYLLPIRLFEEHELEPLRDHVNELIANLPPGGRPEGLDMLHPGDPFLLNWLTQPRILDLVEQIIGPNIVLFASHFISKPAGNGKAVPWHQDSAYWYIDPMRVVTVWLAVDAATRENGCMRVIPRSHRSGNTDHARLNNYGDYVLPLEADLSKFDQEEAVYFELQPGEVSLHDAYLLHGSEANVSSKRRCGYTMRYMPVEARIQRDRWPNHPIYLVRGKDDAGYNTYVKVLA